jgi:hypothetical protein
LLSVGVLFLTKYFSEIERLKKFVDACWTNISTESVKLKVPDLPAELKAFPDRREYSELEVLKLIFTDTLVMNEYIPVINRNLAAKQTQVSANHKRSYNPITLKEFWNFMCRYIVTSLKASGQVDTGDEIIGLSTGIMGKACYKAITGACCPFESELETLSHAYTAQVQIYLHKITMVGSTIVQEWLLYMVWLQKTFL